MNTASQSIPQLIQKTRTIGQLISNRMPNRAWFSSIATVYGDDYAHAYKQDIRNLNPGANRKFRVKSLILKQRHGIQVTRNSISKIELLNKISGNKPLAIGWNCMKCSIFHDNPSFFDVDHVRPRARGGRNHHSNLQILCPNCHRMKSVGIVAQDACFKTVVNIVDISLEK